MSSSEASSHNIITLTTDFGDRDPFVGQMKGVILSIHPSLTLVDISHGIEPQNIEEAAYAVGTSYRFFPSGTIHVAVVDPGVGSGRRAVIVEAYGQHFVGPDNGIFSYILSSSLQRRVVQITQERFMRAKGSPTFQGRDLFAPAAAWLSMGISAEEFGPFIDDPVTIALPVPKHEGDRIIGAVIHSDRFGNAITNITSDDLARFGGHYVLEIQGRTVMPLRHYSQAPDRGLYCLINSSGYIEFFVARASAAELFHIRKGDMVAVLPYEPITE